ncbi:MAG: hypothetical protein WBP81_17035 [Solirubrobacteraceae bacterium]
MSTNQLLLGIGLVLVLLAVGSQLLARTLRLPAGRERAFAGWMAPRGIVAGATASAFGL